MLGEKKIGERCHMDTRGEERRVVKRNQESKGVGFRRKMGGVGGERGRREAEERRMAEWKSRDELMQSCQPARQLPSWAREREREQEKERERKEKGEGEECNINTWLKAKLWPRPVKL